LPVHPGKPRRVASEKNSADAGSGKYPSIYSRLIECCNRTCARLNLKVTLQLVCFQIIRQGSLNIPRFSMMALDQARVIAIHNPNQLGKTGNRARMQTVSEPFGRRCQIRDQIGHADPEI
jgi:hypothetical protein